jgi:hypothetical protein
MWESVFGVLFVTGLLFLVIWGVGRAMFGE